MIYIFAISYYYFSLGELMRPGQELASNTNVTLEHLVNIPGLLAKWWPRYSPFVVSWHRNETFSGQCAGWTSSTRPVVVRPWKIGPPPYQCVNRTPISLTSSPSHDAALRTDALKRNPSLQEYLYVFRHFANVEESDALEAAPTALCAAAACPARQEPTYMLQLINIIPGSIPFIILDIINGMALFADG